MQRELGGGCEKNLGIAKGLQEKVWGEPWHLGGKPFFLYSPPNGKQRSQRGKGGGG